MDITGYVALTRQTGLDKEIQTVANNIANISTTGYRREGVVFAEMVQALPAEGGSVAMTDARARFVDEMQGALMQTGGSLDFAVEGDGYFQVQTPDGTRLTRAGAFTRDAEGQVVNMDGHLLLDEGGGPIMIPFEARDIGLAPDGTLSVDGQPQSRVGLVRVTDPTQVHREAGTLFRARTEPEPVDPADGRMVQGFLEQSNVNAVSEMVRMIEVQRAYESGQKLLDLENRRISDTVKTLGQSA